MLNIPGSIPTIFQVIFKSAESGTLRNLLTLGEQLEGEILETRSPEQFVVRVKGMQVLAQSSSPLPPGKTFLFEVANLKPQVELKIVVPDLTTASGREQLLKSLNLPVDSLFMTALGTILESRLIPTKEQILNLMGLFSNLSSVIKKKDSPVELFRALNILKTVNLPVSEKTFSAALALLNHEVNLGETIGNLENILVRLFEKKEFQNTGMSSIRDLVLKLQQQISSLLGKGEESLPKTPLHQILSMLGIFYDRSIRDQLHHHSAADSVIDQHNLKGLILQLLKQINSQQAKDMNQSFVNLRETLNRVLEQLEYAQIFYSNKSEVNQNIISYVPIPVFFEGKPKTSHAIFQRRRTAKKKSDYWKVHLSIDLDHVGLLFLSLSGLKNFLTLRFICPDEKYMNFLQEETKILPSLLQPLGYSLQNISIEVAQTTADAWYFLIGESLYESNKTIDIKI